MTRPAEGGLKLDAYLPYRLSVASNAVSGLIARAYQDRFGLTIPQWRLVCVLAEDGPRTQAQLVARTVMDKVTVSRAAQGLARRRFVERSDHHADGRSHVLALTEEGRALQPHKPSGRWPRPPARSSGGSPRRTAGGSRRPPGAARRASSPRN